MEIHLRTEDAGEIQLPVLPPSYDANDGSKIDTAFITKDGEHDVYTGTSLRKYKIASEFPSSNREYCSCIPLDPYEYVDTITSWIKGGKIVRFIVTETNINIETRITSFSYGERDGTRDVYYDLSLIEHIPFKFSSTPKTEETKVEKNTKDNKENRPEKKVDISKSKTYEVKEGDCLYKIAKERYGNGNDWKKIYEANKDKIKNPNLVENGLKLVIP